MMKKTVSLSAAKKVAFCGLLGALAIVLTIFENMLPEIPLLPTGCRLGLSNIVTMFCAGTVGLPVALCIALLKTAGEVIQTAISNCAAFVSQCAAYAHTDHAKTAVL